MEYIWAFSDWDYNKDNGVDWRPKRSSELLSQPWERHMAEGCPPWSHRGRSVCIFKWGKHAAPTAAFSTLELPTQHEKCKLLCVIPCQAAQLHSGQLQHDKAGGIFTAGGGQCPRCGRMQCNAWGAGWRPGRQPCGQPALLHLDACMLGQAGALAPRQAAIAHVRQRPGGLPQHACCMIAAHLCKLQASRPLPCPVILAKDLLVCLQRCPFPTQLVTLRLRSSPSALSTPNG